MLINANEATQRLGISKATLRRLGDRGILRVVRTEGGHRRYCSNTIDEYINGHTNIHEEYEEEEGGDGDGGHRILYARVSSSNQKEDLQRQIRYLTEHYPKHRVIHDIGSGLNYKRRGLQAILELSMSGRLRELVVAHRDRLARFGTDLIEWIIHRNGGRVVYIDQTEGPHTPEMDLTEDLISIITVFSCRIQGQRRYHSIKKHESKGLPNGTTEEMVDQNHACPEGPEERSHSTSQQGKRKAIGTEEKDGLYKRQKM